MAAAIFVRTAPSAVPAGVRSVVATQACRDAGVGGSALTRESQWPGGSPGGPGGRVH